MAKQPNPPPPKSSIRPPAPPAPPAKDAGKDAVEHSVFTYFKKFFNGFGQHDGHGNIVMDKDELSKHRMMMVRADMVDAIIRIARRPEKITGEDYIQTSNDRTTDLIDYFIVLRQQATGICLDRDKEIIDRIRAGGE